MAAFGEWVLSTSSLLEGYAEKTTFMRVPQLETMAADLGNQIGFPDDQLRYVLAMLAGYPLAILFSLAPAGTVRHVVSLVSGLFLAQFVFGSGWIHSVVSAVVTYILCSVTSGKTRPLVVFVWMLGYMTASHIYRIYVDYMGWTLDFTGPQMLLTIKLTSLAYALHDGVDDKASLVKKAKDPKDRKAAIYQKRLDQSISGLPNPLEYMGYVYCFTSYLAGPAFGIREYLDVCNGTKFGAGQKAPSRIGSALYVFVTAIVFLGLFMWGSAKFPMSRAFDEEWLNATAFNGPVNWLIHIGNVWLALFFIRGKYYFGWYLSEGSSILSGFGYDPKKKNWRGASNMDWIGFETAQSIRDASRTWNQRTQEWLEMCVYHRSGSSLGMTYFVSAFWHGFYPAYYFFFLSVPLATTVNRLAHKRIRPLFVGSALKPAYDVFSFICTTLTMNYLAACFQALSLERSIATWKGFYFAFHIIAVVLYFAIPMFFKAPKRKDPKKNN